MHRPYQAGHGPSILSWLVGVPTLRTLEMHPAASLFVLPVSDSARQPQAVGLGLGSDVRLALAESSRSEFQDSPCMLSVREHV